jgi:hypothetical protein
LTALAIFLSHVYFPLKPRRLNPITIGSKNKLVLSRTYNPKNLTLTGKTSLITKTMVRRAIKIDVEQKDCYYIDLPKGLQNIYDAIGNGCNLIECATYVGTNAFYVDEEICFRPSDVKGGWALPNSPQVYVNNSVIVGTTDEGEDDHVQLDLNYLKAIITFYNAK